MTPLPLPMPLLAYHFSLFYPTLSSFTPIFFSPLKRVYLNFFKDYNFQKYIHYRITRGLENIKKREAGEDVQTNPKETVEGTPEEEREDE